MESTLSNALILMVIGMVSVFIVLLIVVIGGSLLINIINKYLPETAPMTTAVDQEQPSLNSINKGTMAAITAAVMLVTNGNGHIDEIIKK